MRLRYKFFGIYALVFASVLTVVAVSLDTQRKSQEISDALTLGNGLLEQSRKVRQITKDVMFASFAPESYSALKDILYFDTYAVALRNWAAESDIFQKRFRSFMGNPVLLGLVSRGVLKDEYDTALIMSGKAFEKLDGLRSRLDKIGQEGLLGEDLYVRIQVSSDPDLIALFDETRQTSYYLANSFESYLNYFMDALSREADSVRSDLVRSFIILGLVTAGAATLITLIFASRIVARLKNLGEGLKRVSAGDFSTPLLMPTGDEFQDLAYSFNRYTDTLKSNLAAMVALARRVAESAFGAERAAPGPSAQGGYDPVDLVLDAVVRGARESLGEGSAVLVVASGGAPRIRRQEPPETDNGWDALVTVLSALEDGAAPCMVEDGRWGRILAGPLGVAGRRFGVLALRSQQRSFNDLDLIRFENYLEFGGLLADNAATYAELLEERNAEYLALQSQVRPHFMYNVLGGFAALNRMGDRRTLEESILALKELLRYTVDHGSEATVAEEFSFLRRYCELQRMRFQHRLSWTIAGDGELMGRRIPKLILQPLVENAVIHGIEPSGEPGTLAVAVRREGELLVFTVEDDGEGFDPELTEKGVGLRNIERRLALAYPSGTGGPIAKLWIESRPGKGTRAVLTIPELP